jgi:hypothetical protein
MQRYLSITWLGGLLAAGWLVAALPGCSASDSGLASCTSRSCDGYSQTGGNAIIPKETGPTNETAPPADSGPSRNPLCGTIGCFPGFRNACGVNPTDAAGFDYTFSDGGDSAASDSPESSSSDATADVSISEASTDEASTSDAPSDAGSTDEPRVSQSCYIGRGDAGPGVTTQCAPVGSVPEGGECQDSSDCVELNACVEVARKGVCRPVSCALPIICRPGTYYREVTLRIGGMSSNLSVPVCLPNDHCIPLTEPSPCSEPLEVCAVVGSQGETACIVPGPGKQGDDCDERTNKGCAKGLLCSKFNNQCVRLCHVSADVNECVGGICQGGNKSIPEGFGICVGEIPDASR